RRPEGHVALAQLAGDPRVDLAPCGRDLAHQRQPVAALAEVEAGERAHRPARVAIPPRMRFAGAAPVIGCRRLLVEMAEPAAGARVELGDLIVHPGGSRSPSAA